MLPLPDHRSPLPAFNVVAAASAPLKQKGKLCPMTIGQTKRPTIRSMRGGRLQTIVAAARRPLVSLKEAP